MNKYTLKAENVTQIFGRRLIFENVDFKLESGNIYGLAGHNGSGKSTLSKIIAGIITPTKGKILHSLNDNVIIGEKLHNHMGYIAPYLVLYDEFTAEENFKHFAKIRGVEYNEEKVKHLLDEFNIYDRRKDLLKEYSSGMQQRVKFIFALQHSPQLLLLDEPTSNLDNVGKEKVYEIIKNENSNCLTIIASNEDSDLALCSEIIEIENYKRNK